MRGGTSGQGKTSQGREKRQVARITDTNGYSERTVRGEIHLLVHVQTRALFFTIYDLAVSRDNGKIIHSVAGEMEMKPIGKFQ